MFWGDLGQEDLEDIKLQWGSEISRDPDLSKISDLDSLSQQASLNQRRIRELEKLLGSAKLLKDNSKAEEYSGRLAVRQIRSSQFIRRREEIKQHIRKAQQEEYDRKQQELNKLDVFVKLADILRDLVGTMEKIQVDKKKFKSETYSPQYRDLLAAERSVAGSIELLTRVKNLAKGY